NAWRLLDEAGAEIAPNTQQVEFKRSSKLNFEDTGERVSVNGVELFNPLNEAEKQSLIDAGTVHELPEAEPIVRYNDEGQSFFVVLSGMVRVFRPVNDKDGPEVELARLCTGSYFGEMSLLTGERRSASVSAHTKARVLEIPKSAMAPILLQRPSLAEDLARIMAQRKLSTESAISDGDGKSFADRLSESTRELVQRIQKFFKE
ncbi:MAG: cyclic nucleotide-binding domain-containing protein, partial [Pseudomonadota bacterium]